MIVDSSAVVSIILGEPEAADLVEAMARASSAKISAANWLEAAMAVDSRGSVIFSHKFGEVLDELRLQVVPVTLDHAKQARTAHQRYGRGNHPARLNYGDCFAYALAKITGEPLLFKGDDFSQTDVEPALKPPSLNP